MRPGILPAFAVNRTDGGRSVICSTALRRSAAVVILTAAATGCGSSRTPATASSSSPSLPPASIKPPAAQVQPQIDPIARDVAEVARLRQDERDIGEYVAQAHAARAQAWADAAQRGSADGKLMLAICFLRGIGGEPDREAGLAAMRDAANFGSRLAMTELAVILIATGQHEDALRWLNKAADAGDTTALVRIAQMYYDGKGVARDEQAAVKMLHRASAAGSSQALRA